MTVVRAAAKHVLALMAAMAGGSCLPDAVFDCEHVEQCSALGQTASCEAGYCTQADSGCASGRRFHDSAGEGLAGQCTDVTCGDGQTQQHEECDDANDIDGDGCNRDCRVSGQEVWTVTYASPGDVRDRCYSVASDDHGNIAVIGHVTTAGQGWDLWVRQYDADGQPGWTWVLDGDAHVDEEGWSILSVDGDAWLVSGYVTTVAGEQDAWMGRIDANGILVWDATFEGGTSWYDQARDVTVADDGDIVAIGYATVIRDRETDLWFQRRSPDGSVIRWTKHRDGLEDNAQDRAHGIAKVAGGYVGVGMKQTVDETRFWIERFDEQGNTVWTDEGVAGAPSSVWTGVATTPEGDILLAGWKASSHGDTDMWIQRRAPDGQILWDEIIASPGGDDDKANVLAIDERGGFIVGGEMGAGAGSTDAWIRRYSPERTEVWTQSYSGPAGARDTTWGLDIAGDGSVYACGYQSTPGSEWDLWVRRLTP